MSTSIRSRQLLHPDPDLILRAMQRRSFCVVSTVSEAGRPHAAGLLYALADGALYASTMGDSRKARNIAGSGRVGVVIPVRRLPVGPPSSIQFQASAQILERDDRRLLDLADAGKLKAITGHGELELEGGVFVRIELPRWVTTYGLGLSLLRLIRDPLNAAGETELGG